MSKNAKNQIVLIAAVDATVRKEAQTFRTAHARAAATWIGFLIAFRAVAQANRLTFTLDHIRAELKALQLTDNASLASRLVVFAFHMTHTARWAGLSATSKRAELDALYATRPDSERAATAGNRKGGRPPAKPEAGAQTSEQASESEGVAVARAASQAERVADEHVVSIIALWMEQRGYRDAGDAIRAGNVLVRDGWAMRVDNYARKVTAERQAEQSAEQDTDEPAEEVVARATKGRKARKVA
jgi:hypothetical protein